LSSKDFLKAPLKLEVAAIFYHLTVSFCSIKRLGDFSFNCPIPINTLTCRRDWFLYFYCLYDIEIYFSFVIICHININFLL